MLQITSIHAEQRVTVLCRSLAIRPFFTGYKQGTIFTLGDGLAPEVVHNGCSVSWGTGIW